MTREMDDETIAYWTLVEIRDAIAKKQLSSTEVTRSLLERIQSDDKQLNSFITVAADSALSSASQLDKELINHRIRGPLHGVPIGIKDIIYTRDLMTTMGAETYRGYISSHDATVVERLKSAGAIIIGKLNTHQFAYGPTGDRSDFGPVRNPYNLAKISGGSSSGSGAAVAAGLCYAAIGTDTGGSVRIPSSCCGIVGMKPTFGRMSKNGIYPLSWTLDHLGPMTRSVEDSALLLSVLSGYDAKDPCSSHRDSEDFARYIDKDLGGKIVGVPASFYFDGVDPEVESKVRKAVDRLHKLGVEIREIQIPRIHDTLDAQRTTIAAESFAVHYHLLNNFPDQYEEEVRNRLLAGEAIQAREYINAQQVKSTAVREFEEIFAKIDVLAAPTLPILPTDLNQRSVSICGIEESVCSALTRLTAPTNLTGFPSISVPCGTSDTGLPIGLQLIAGAFNEATLYQFGYALEASIC